MPFPPTPTAMTCPFCRARITVPLRQIVDVSEEPALKEALLAGRLNAFKCPSCGNTGALASPFFYHDPNKELAFIFLPMEIGLKNTDQERLIGSLTNAVMSNLPPEKRKAYLLQPKQFFNLQNLVDTILEADGITPEMIAAQRARMDLLQQMVELPGEQAPAFIKEHDAQLDEEFFELLSAVLASAQAGGAAPEDYSRMVGLRNLVLEHSTIGGKVVAQQKILEAFTSNPTHETLLEQLINAPEAETREVLVGLGRPMLDYPFFQALTAKIEAATTAGDKELANRLLALRKEIQETREKLDAATREVFEKRAALLRELMANQELDKAARAHLEELDDIFFNVLEANMSAAQQAGQQDALERLQAVGEAVMRAIQSTQPPEVRFVQALLSADYPDKTAKLLEANKKALSPQLLSWMRRLAEDMRKREQNDVADKLDKIIQQAAEMSGQGIAIAKA